MVLTQPSLSVSLPCSERMNEKLVLKLGVKKPVFNSEKLHQQLSSTWKSQVRYLASKVGRLLMQSKSFYLPKRCDFKLLRNKECL
jgi:hypothetical protein